MSIFNQIKSEKISKEILQKQTKDWLLDFSNFMMLLYDNTLYALFW